MTEGTTAGGYVETTSSARPGTGGPAGSITIDQPATADLSLPSEHIDHTTVLRTEMNIRLAQFDAGIVALEQERNGQVEKFDADQAERKSKHDNALADLDRRIADLKKGRRMLASALDESERK